MAIPVGIEPSMDVRGKTVALDIKIGGLAITEHTLWLGANVAVHTTNEGEPTAGKAAKP
jgi:hypothetical protein